MVAIAGRFESEPSLPALMVIISLHTSRDNHETPIEDNLNTAFIVSSLPQKPSACMEEISIKLTKSVQYSCS